MISVYTVAATKEYIHIYIYTCISWPVRAAVNAQDSWAMFSLTIGSCRGAIFCSHNSNSHCKVDTGCSAGRELAAVAGP